MSMSLARLRSLVVLGVFLIFALVIATVAIVKDRQAHGGVGGCAAGAVPVDLRLPERNEDMKVKVVNGTDQSGLAAQVADEFRSRNVNVVAQSTEKQPKNQFVAQLRYGPNMVGTAWLVNAYFFSRGELLFDPNRKDDVVDIVLGAKFKQLGTRTEVNQSLGSRGRPQLPHGTCAKYAH